MTVAQEVHDNRVVVVDFGGETTQLIARRIREANVYCEVVPWQQLQDGTDDRPRAFVLSDGPAERHGKDGPPLAGVVLASGVPVLGIGYGQELLIRTLGGKVLLTDGDPAPAVGEVELTGTSPLLAGGWAPGRRQTALMGKHVSSVELPAGFVSLGEAPGVPFAIVADEARRYYGLQFHPESIHTPAGAELIRHFVLDVAGAQPLWNMAAFRAAQVAAIRAQVGETGRVVCGLSGGVDSAVTAVLIHEAIGDRLTCIFVDHGLLRLGEPEEVDRLFRDHFHIPLVHVDARRRFLSGLAGVTDPEEKRKFIGRTFIEVFDEEASKIGDVRFLAQGTVYPDVIESAHFGKDGGTVAVKSHHNVGGLPERMNMELVEPLRELFKDEVRALGRELGLPEVFVGRHPFPGPGIAIRIPGEVTEEACDTLRLADAIYLDEIRKAGLYDTIWQAFAVLLPVRTVGVSGDRRTYERVCALRAIVSTDGMTAEVYPFTHEFLARVTARIISEVPGINRVVYDCTPKPPGTVEWE